MQQSASRFHSRRNMSSGLRSWGNRALRQLSGVRLPGSDAVYNSWRDVYAGRRPAEIRRLQRSRLRAWHAVHSLGICHTAEKRRMRGGRSARRERRKMLLRKSGRRNLCSDCGGVHAKREPLRRRYSRLLQQRPEWQLSSRSMHACRDHVHRVIVHWPGMRGLAGNDHVSPDWGV
jgi:hypothetical protein